jgi:hypothetical protein
VAAFLFFFPPMVTSEYNVKKKEVDGTLQEKENKVTAET